MKKNTKIIATVSDRKCDVEFLTGLRDKGVNAFRMNTAHQTPEDTLKIVNNVRSVSKMIPIIVDTKGPEVRTCPQDEGIYVSKGDKITFKGENGNNSSSDIIYVNYKNFSEDVPVNSRILYDDGEMAFKVLEKNDKGLLCEVLNEGTIAGKKSINVPGVTLKLPSLTEKDKEYVAFSAKNNIDFIAHSFIRNKEDLYSVQKILDEHKSETKIIAKIENKEGVDNIDEILDNCAGIMVARGDLAIEIPAQSVPPIQKMLIKKAIQKRKVVITATQMLHTMIENPRPTRAEISDVANAVYDGSDCVMLSGETAYGKYPFEAVEIMTRVIQEVEAVQKRIRKTTIKTLPEEAHAYLAWCAINATLQFPVKGIITDTLTGRTARFLSAFRGREEIYALCYNDTVARQLCLSFGVYPEVVPKRETDPFFKEKLQSLLDSNEAKLDDKVVLLSGYYDPLHGSSRLEISEIKNLLENK